jgi:hypothetical protein
MSGQVAEQNDPNPPRCSILLVGRNPWLTVRKAADPQYVCSILPKGMKESDSPFPRGPEPGSCGPPNRTVPQSIWQTCPYKSHLC